MLIHWAANASHTLSVRIFLNVVVPYVILGHDNVCVFIPIKVTLIKKRLDSDILHPQYMGPCHASEPNHSERDQPVHQPVHVQVSRRSGGHHDPHKGQHT